MCPAGKSEPCVFGCVSHTVSVLGWGGGSGGRGASSGRNSCIAANFSILRDGV